MGTSSFSYITSAQALRGASPAAATTTSPNANVTGQNLHVLCAGDISGGAGSVNPTDSSSNTYTQDLSDSNNYSQSYIGHSLGGSGSSGFNWTGTVDKGVVVGLAFSGAKTSSVPDFAATPVKPSASSASSFTVGPVTASVPGCLFVASITFGGGGTPGNGITVSAASAAAGWIMAQAVAPTSNSVGLAVAYKIENADTPAAQSCTFDVSGGSTDITGVLELQAFRPQIFTPSFTWKNLVQDNQPLNDRRLAIAI